MEIKMLEIRDKATFMPVMAIDVCAESEEQKYLLSRAGFGTSGRGDYKIVIKMVGDITANYDEFSWGNGARTMPIAHKHIRDYWDDLNDGDVVDVEFILGETESKKVSERYG